MSDGDDQRGWYLAGLGAWFISGGAQSVVFPFLVAVELEQSASRVGFAQTAMLLPALLLMLFGGATADRNDCRRLLIWLHVLAALPSLMLAAASLWSQPGYWLLIGYAMAMGTVVAFVIPARDSLLSRVSGGDLQRMVLISFATQAGTQVLGIVLGGTASSLGAPFVLTAQGVLMLVGAAFSYRLRPAPPAHTSTAGNRLGEIREGLAEVARSPRLLPVTLSAVSIGLFFMGVVNVLIPLLVRDVYGGSSPQIAGASGALMLGMLGGTGALFARGGVQRQGRALVLSLASGAVILGSLASQPPEWLFYVLIFSFGLAGGVAMPTGRTLVQEAASPAHRARILSVYSLGFMGAAPIGALSMGGLADAIGLVPAIVPPAISMLVFVGALVATTGIWHFEGSAPAVSGDTEPL